MKKANRKDKETNFLRANDDEQNAVDGGKKFK